MTPPATRYVVGIDLSTTRLDLVAVPLAPAPITSAGVVRLDIPPERGPANPCARCIRLGVTLAESLATPGPPIDTVAIEEPFGPHRNTDRALLPILGALSMACHPLPVAWYAPDAWRRILGARGRHGQSKAGGHEAVRAHAPAAAEGLDEHALDALGVALAHRRIIDVFDTGG